MAACRWLKVPRRLSSPLSRTAVPSSTSDPKDREKALAAMVRAGHGFGLSRAIVNLTAGAGVDVDELGDYAAGHG